MELKLPMCVLHQGARLIEVWLPLLPGVRKLGPSLAQLRDDLALDVMLRFETEAVARLGAYQLPPHISLRHVDVDTIARDQERRRKLVLKGRLGVLVEKWPADDFWIVTPTRLPAARFALRNESELDAALARRLAAYCLAQGIPSLEPFHATRRERLDILEVDADPPSILPRGAPRPAARRRKKKASAKTVAGAQMQAVEETPEQRDERRRKRRLTVKTLRAVARNLSHGALDDTLDRAYGREALVRGLCDDLEGREGAAIVLCGPSGCGKTALVHELTRRLTARQAAAGTRRDVWRVDGNRFIAGMMYVGQWEARARELCDELVDTGDILYVDDLASLIYSGRTRSSDTNVAQFLEPHLGRGELTVIAESTAERFEKVREEAPTFAALFRVVHVPAMTEQESLPVLLGVLRELEAGAEGAPPRMSPPALETLLHALERFVGHEAFPGKAVRMLRRVTAGPGTWAQGARRFEAAQVYEVLRRQTGLPDFVLGNAPPRPREQIVSELSAHVAGQPEAIEAVTDAVLAMQHSLNDPDKPLSTCLFVGPTGVGKTETAKALARYLFGSAERLLRYDMSEFSSSASISRLIGLPGAPDGELTTALRAQPFCVILLDEIEKAHPRVFDALLQLLGEGRITDAAGRTADARQAVIIMTSNLGVREAAARPGFGDGGAGTARAHYLSAVRAFFRPEFFNRIDRIVPFRSLDRPSLRMVVEHALGELLSRRGIRRGNVLVDVEPALLDLLVEQAYDPRFGARPLRRALERRLTVPLAHHLVRRGSDDLALVELYRRGEDMGLAVRLLTEGTPLAAGPSAEADATVAELRTLAEQARATIAGVAATPFVASLADGRRQALLSVAEGGSAAQALPAGFDLLERLTILQEELRDLDEAELGDVHYVEEADPVAERDLHRPWESDNPSRGQKGLRPRAAYRDIPVRANPELVIRRLRPRVLALRDQAVVLAHQVAAAAAGAPAAWTVVLECIGEHAREALEHATSVVPMQLARAQRHDELVRADGVIEWLPIPYHRPGARLRRICFSVEGPGVGELLASYAGHGLMLTMVAGAPRTIPIRIEVLPGGEVGPAAVRAHDARVAIEREARRQGAAPATVPAPGVVVLRQLERAAIPIHLASGLPVNMHITIASAILRGG